MQRLTLRLRSFLAASIAMLVFAPLTIWTLDQAHKRSLTSALNEQLRVQSYMLISEFELSDDGIRMPDFVFSEGFNLIDSGLYAFIEVEEEVVWQSASALSVPTLPRRLPPPIGESRFNPLGDNQPGFIYSFTAEFSVDNQYQAVHFFIVDEGRQLRRDREQFSQTLMIFIGLMTLALLALLVLSLNAAFRPMGKLLAQIHEIEQGHSDKIKAHYPPELETLKSGINHLLSAQTRQRERYKNALSDLAHSLKTPLAVLSSTPDLPKSMLTPIDHLSAIIERQLKRAVAMGGAGWQTAVPIYPVVEQLVHTMEKIHRDKSLTFDYTPQPGEFFGDRTDLLEMLGNLLDNACKAAASKVSIAIEETSTSTKIIIDDDGSGFEPSKVDKLLKRGARLDTYREGQGIGLAVVNDLVTAYQGTLILTQSPDQGARVLIEFRRS